MMKKTTVCRIFLLLSIWRAVAGFGQPRLEFDHFTIENGLPDNQLHDAIIDKKGFLWLATEDGLARFDGQAFRTFRNEESNPQSICGNTVLDLDEATDGQIWAAAIGAGLSRLDPRTGRCENWTKTGSGTGHSVLPTNAITSILLQGRDSVWLGSMTHGLLLLNKKNGKTQEFPLGKEKIDSEPVAWNSCFQVLRDPANPRFLLLAAAGRGLVHFDTKTGTARSDTLIFPGLLAPNRPKPPAFKPDIFLIEPGIISPIGRTGSAANCLFADRPNEIWIGSWSCGLVRVDRVTGKPTFFVPDEQEFLHGNPFRNIVTSIARKSETEFWVGTLDMGLLVFDQKTHQFSPVTGVNLPDKKISGLLADPLGRLFVLGKNSGFFRADAGPEMFRFLPAPGACSNGDEANEVAAFAFDAGRRAHWFAVRHCDRVFKKDKRDGQVEAVAFRPALFAAQLVNCLFTDRTGRVWVGTGFDVKGQNSLWLFNEKSRFFTPFSGFGGKEILPNHLKINELQDDGNGNLWLATEGGGLVKIDFSQQKITVLDSIPGIRNFNKKTVVTALRVAQNGNIWFATDGSGAFSASPDLRFVVAVPGSEQAQNSRISCLEIAGDGKIWLGTTSNGILLFDPQKPAAPPIRLGENAGLLDEKIQKMAFDSAGNIYVSTMRGLARWDKNSGRFDHFGKKNGLLEEQLTQKGLFASPSGQLFVGQKNGFCEAELSSFFEKKTRPLPPVAITDFLIFEKSLRSDSLLEVPSEVTLGPGQNLWTVRFAALDFRAGGQVKFLYKLENFDADWRSCTGCDGATYTNLPGGAYVFRVRLAEDLKGENEAMVRLIIRPPFWATGWFRFLAAASVAGLALIFFRWRIRLEREKADFLQKEAEMKAKMAEFQQKTAEMEMAAMRAQMNPHFIFNCLNSINTFIVTHQTERAGMYLEKFSRLMRLVLDNSRSDQIALSSELEMLRFYVEMEQMRFEGRFGFELRVAENVPVHSLEIPPMLVQPFVENAIWHGLLHRRSDGGNLLIIMELVKNSDHEFLKITIEDNGIGRARAAELKSKSATKHKSHGLKITADRLSLINQIYRFEATAEVEDLTKGTRVTVRVPV